MSGFSTQWLDLREPADHAARDPALLAAAAAYLRDGGEAAPLAVDLGSGTGSTARAFAPIAGDVRWRLVDNDPQLLDTAGSRLAALPSVTCVTADLTRLGAEHLDGARLVTASALFDLVSRAFVDELADRLAARRIGLYAALSYDGGMAWDEPLPDDGVVVAAFNEHQHGDKGFGPALGPGAAAALREAFGARGFFVRRSASPWRLGPGAEVLHGQLVEGIAAAVAETGRIEPARLHAWRDARLRTAAVCHVGHEDLLALPPGHA